jgi:hypothetical protein
MQRYELFNNSKRPQSGPFDQWFYPYLDTGSGSVDSRLSNSDAVRDLLRKHGFNLAEFPGLN